VCDVAAVETKQPPQFNLFSPEPRRLPTVSGPYRL
jgi:hypothetical protein